MDELITGALFSPFPRVDIIFLLLLVHLSTTCINTHDIDFSFFLVYLVFPFFSFSFSVVSFNLDFFLGQAGCPGQTKMGKCGNLISLGMGLGECVDNLVSFSFVWTPFCLSCFVLCCCLRVGT